MKPERKLWLDLKKNTPTICWNRIENLAVPGLPDVLGYNKHQQFFTVELKVTRSNSIRFSPHQIAFHVTHPKNTFILVKSLASSLAYLYEGKNMSLHRETIVVTGTTGGAGISTANATSTKLVRGWIVGIYLEYTG